VQILLLYIIIVRKLLLNAQHRVDFCIPEFQRQAFEIYLFENADFQKSPSDIALKFNILVQILNFNVLLGDHQNQLECESHRCTYVQVWQSTARILTIILKFNLKNQVTVNQVLKFTT
jgi:hypothetical protein